MNRYRSTYRRAEDYGDRNARLAGEGWSGHVAKCNPRRQPDGPTLRELGALAAKYRALESKQKEAK